MGKLQRLTGRDTLTLRAAHAREPITVTEPTHTLCLLTNHKLQILPEQAILDRIRLLELHVHFDPPFPWTRRKLQYTAAKTIISRMRSLLPSLGSRCSDGWRREPIDTINAAVQFSGLHASWQTPRKCGVNWTPLCNSWQIMKRCKAPKLSA